jgi:hypothetical protein
MTTRFNVPASQDRLSSGYSNNNRVVDFTIPSCGIEDVDIAIFNLFNKDLPLVVSSENTIIPVKTIFAAGEKWAMIKKKKEIRDRNGRLILPLITIGRSSIEQNIKDDITGRGINQQTGEIVIKRRLMKSDRNYQNLFNRLFINHQSNVAINQGTLDVNDDSQLMTKRDIGDLFNVDVDVSDGALMKPMKDENIWETLTLPAPQFFSAHYDIVIWTQYTTHMNQILETLLSAQLPQGNSYKISNPQKPDYWFIASAEDKIYKPDNNWDDMFEKERIIKYSFSLTVPAYILATNVPGAPVPIRRYVSCTHIEFKTNITDDLANVSVDANTIDSINDPWLGVDDPSLPYDHVNPTRLQRQDARLTNDNRLDDKTLVNKNDPAMLNISRGKQPDKYIKVRSVDRNGNIKYKNIKIRNVNKHTGESTINAGDFDLDGMSFSIDR